MYKSGHEKTYFKQWLHNLIIKEKNGRHTQYEKILRMHPSKVHDPSHNSTIQFVQIDLHVLNSSISKIE